MVCGWSGGGPVGCPGEEHVWAKELRARFDNWVLPPELLWEAFRDGDLN